VDPHVHLIPGGLFLSKVNLRELRGGRQEFAQRLAAAAASDSSSSSSSGGGDAGLLRWLLGIGWSESDWGGQLPDRNWIDEVGSHAQPPGGGGGAVRAPGRGGALVSPGVNRGAKGGGGEVHHDASVLPPENWRQYTSIMVAPKFLRTSL
jgi:hypothetical protein